jgi:hypothetical protein
MARSNIADSLTLFSAGFGNDPSAAPNPFSATPGYPPPSKPSRWWLWLLGGLGCGGLLLILCCGVFGYFGFRASTEILAQALRGEIANNDAVKEHLGEINSLQTNFAESAKEKQTRGGGNNWIVFDAVGTKGSGKFITEMPPTPQQGNMFNSIELRLPDGSTVKVK